MRVLHELQSESEPFSAPVFVDDTGRRHRRFRLSARGSAALFAAYLALTIAGFTGHGPLAGIRLPFLAPTQDASAHATGENHNTSSAGVTNQRSTEQAAIAGTADSTGALDRIASGSDPSGSAATNPSQPGGTHDPSRPGDAAGSSSTAATVPGVPGDPIPPAIDPPTTPTTNPAGHPISSGNPAHGPDKSQGSGAANGTGGTNYTPGVPNDSANPNAAGNANAKSTKAN